MAVNQQLASKLAMRGGAAVDIDNAALRVTLDVIGRVGFGKDFAATASLDDPCANAAFDLMGAGARRGKGRAQRLPAPMLTGGAPGAGRDEGIKRWNSPLRKYLVFMPVRCQPVDMPWVEEHNRACAAGGPSARRTCGAGGASWRGSAR